jgi:hypothetical protein
MAVTVTVAHSTKIAEYFAAASPQTYASCLTPFDAKTAEIATRAFDDIGGHSSTFVDVYCEWTRLDRPSTLLL